MSQSTESVGATVNGQPSLSERVKGLRLNDPRSGSGSRGGGSAWLPWTLCFLMAITWASFGIRAYTSGSLFKGSGEGTSSPGEATAKSEGGKGPKAPAGSTAAAGELMLDVKGNIVAAHQIQVSPIEVSGRIVKLFIEEGKAFKKGEVLAELDTTSYKADFDEAKAYLDSAESRLKELKESWPLEKEQAKAQLDESEALFSQYERDYTRFENLRKNNTSVAEKEYELAKFTFSTQTAKVAQMKFALKLIEGPREHRIRTAEAEVGQARARFDRTKWRLDNCKIVAPVDGIILTKRAEVGNLVNALAMNTALNGGICDMADLTDLEVDMEIEERDIHQVFVDQLCVVSAVAYPDVTYQARVARILPVANSSKAIIPVRVKVRVQRSEEGKFLKPQMGAVVWFYKKTAPPEPAEALPPVREK